MPTDRSHTITLREMFNPAINYRQTGRVPSGLSLLPPESYRGKRLLDFGCGAAPKRTQVEQSGARWVGVDLYGSRASVYGDCHSLPFRDESFDIVFSNAVFEHLQNPFVGTAEIARVLRPGGFCIGYVAFLEPYHASYFHCSHRGLEHLLGSQRLVVTDIFPSRPGVERQLEGLLFPRHLPVVTIITTRTIRAALFVLKELLSGVAWLGLRLRHLSAHERREKHRLFRLLMEIGHTGGLTFKAQKPSSTIGAA